MAGKTVLKQDRQFVDLLVDWLEAHGYGRNSCIALYFNDDGTLNRKKILEGPQFAGAADKPSEDDEQRTDETLGDA